MDLTKKVLVSEDALAEKVRELAQRINTDYAGLELNLVCLTNSAMTFTADLMRHLNVPTKLHLLAFTSYNPAPASGEVRLTLDVAEPLHGKHVLLLEGMVISGRTPLYLMNMLKLRNPASIEMCVIGNKPAELAVELPIKYKLFEFQKEWVAGYGIGHGNEKASSALFDNSLN